MTQSEQFLAGEQAADRLAEATVDSDAGRGLQDQRLIEAGFPCHQVGAETQRERGASSALPPLYYLHVWWARRPLTPSRAAILASLLPADADPEEFIQRLGIVRYQSVLGETHWTLVSKPMLSRIQKDQQGLFVEVDEKVQEAIETERERRAECRERVETLRNYSIDLAQHPALTLLSEDCRPLPDAIPLRGSRLDIIETPADPAGVKEKIEFAKRSDVSDALGSALRLDPEDSYGYSRAFSNPVEPIRQDQRKVILDPTAGGGSIPFEALRLGHKVIANELNPVASVILTATADYPSRFGISLLDDIKHWGERLVSTVEDVMAPFTPFSPIPAGELDRLKGAVASEPELIADYDREHDHMGLLYCRQVELPRLSGQVRI